MNLISSGMSWLCVFLRPPADQVVDTPFTRAIYQQGQEHNGIIKGYLKAVIGRFEAIGPVYCFDGYQHGNHQRYSNQPRTQSQYQQDHSQHFRTCRQVSVEYWRRYTNAAKPINDTVDIFPFHFGRSVKTIGQHQSQ